MRQSHVRGTLFAVVLWIGGVGFVTTVLLPAIRHLQGARGAIGLFRCIPAAICMASPYHHWLTGLSGLYMLIRFDLWGRFLSASFWWIHAMVVVWLLFTVMLYLDEPLFLHRWTCARKRSRGCLHMGGLAPGRIERDYDPWRRRRQPRPQCAGFRVSSFTYVFPKEHS